MRCVMALRRTASGQGSVAPVTRDGRTFRTCLIWQVEAAVETSGSKPQPPWVPYYVMHKILAGLLSHFEVAAVVVMAAVVRAALVVVLMAVVVLSAMGLEGGSRCGAEARDASEAQGRCDGQAWGGRVARLHQPRGWCSLIRPRSSSPNSPGQSTHSDVGRRHVRGPGRPRTAHRRCELAANRRYV